MSEEIPQDRKDRIDAMDTILNRMDNPGLTLEEKIEISFGLQIESVRATKLMLSKNFVQRGDLESHCESMHKAQPWNFARFSAVTISVLLVCSTAVGITMKLAPEKMDPPQPHYYVSPDKRNQPEE